MSQRKQETIDLGPLQRDLPASEIVVTRDAADGPVKLSFPASSETPVERWFGTEVLSHAPGAVRMDRLKGGSAPLLFNHAWGDPVGMVTGARIKDSRLWVDAQLFATDRAKEVAQMIDGGLRNVSIGYELYSVEENVKTQTYTARDWGVLEVSVVTVPADPSVGIGRSADDKPKPVRITRAGEVSQPAAKAAPERSIAMSDQENAAAGANAEDQSTSPNRSQPAQPQGSTGNRAMELETARRRGIENLCKAGGIDASIRDHWIGTGLSVDEISGEYLQIVQQRADKNKTVAAVGLSGNEAKRYSLMAAIRACSDKNWTNAGFELECSREIAKRLNVVVDPNKFYVPFEVQGRGVEFEGGSFMTSEARRQMRPMGGRRDATVASGSGGGYLVGTENVSFIELLRNRAVAYRMGARRLSGLVGNVTVPRHTAAATAYWLSSESTQVTESQQTYGQLSLSPKTVGAYTEISRQLMLQSSPDAEGIVTSDLASTAALALDVGVLRGAGSSGEPQGIVGTSGIGSVTGTSLAFEDILEFQTDVAGGNIYPAAGGYVTTPAVASLCIQRVKYSSTASPLWEGNVWDGTMQGFPAMGTNQMSAATMLFGDWSQVVVGEWGVLQVEVNPYANFQAGIIGVRAMVTCDVGLRYAAAFSYASSIT